MRVVGYHACLPIDAPNALIDLDLPAPVPGPRDLLVAVRAVSVNPLDTKVRKRDAPAPGAAKVLGWDAAGVVAAVGDEVALFKPGDAVFYAGALERAGTNAEFHVVDERIAGPKPITLDFAQAAALPLTTITAWEMLFDRLDVRRPVPGQAAGVVPAILVIGGAGGVGSIAIQLARQLTDLTVIATASRPETMQWCRDLGAHHVIDHSRPIAAQVAALGIGEPGFVLSTTQTDLHIAEIAQLIAPQGRIALIDDPAPFDIKLLKRKSLSLVWEFMFTRPFFHTADVLVQHEILKETSRLVDAGVIKTTLAESFGVINAANLIRAHALLESGTARGKIVLAGF